MRKVLEKIRIARKQKHDKKIEELSPETQIILNNYMRKIKHYGKEMYAVRNIKRFDSCLKKHIFQKLNKNVDISSAETCYKFNEYIHKCYEDGDAFLVIINGKEYVAISPTYLIDPDSLV